MLQAGAHLRRARATWLKEAHDAKRRTNGLSVRQREVMVRLLSGQPNKVVAKQLNISVRTVEKHRKQMHGRTETTTLLDLLRVYLAAERPLTAAYSLSFDDLSMLLCIPVVQPPCRLIINGDSISNDSV